MGKNQLSLLQKYGCCPLLDECAKVEKKDQRTADRHQGLNCHHSVYEAFNSDVLLMIGKTNSFQKGSSCTDIKTAKFI